MAGMQFNVQGKTDVDRWIERAEDLNKRAETLIQESGKVLQVFGQTAEGQVFDQVVEYSDAVIDGMGKVLGGMNQILDTVAKVALEITNKIDDLGNGVKNICRNVVGNK